MKLNCESVRPFFMWLAVAVFAVLCSGCESPKKTADIDLDPQEVEGQLSLAYKYYLGEEIEFNPKRAAELFLKAAGQGNTEAQFALGCMYQNGQGVTQNYMEAVKYYLQAARQGHANAQYLLGLSYKEGSGVSRDMLESFKWLHLAAEQGIPEHIEARNHLALLLTPDLVVEGKRRAVQFREKELN
ncbi:MAG: sel1 repeat family protein [Pedosphaera sp.]|nr:sel1 repeat family protein [Pedosphaera sp.]